MNRSLYGSPARSRMSANSSSVTGSASASESARACGSSAAAVRPQRGRVEVEARILRAAEQGSADRPPAEARDRGDVVGVGGLRPPGLEDPVLQFLGGGRGETGGDVPRGGAAALGAGRDGCLG